MKNQKLFEIVKSRIIEASTKEDYKLLDLSDLGFSKEDIKDSRLIHELHKYEEDNENIEVDFRCYDLSGPFQNLKNINKFTLAYTIDGKSVNSYETSYED